MGDALCGPSNALQNFQKHATVDRSLQQDRRAPQSQSNQGFRSAQGPPSGTLDHEFNTFQTSFHAAPDFNNPREFVARDFHTSAPAAVPQPAWANDFQRLHISAPVPQTLAPTHMTSAVDTASWHLDFLKQSSSAHVSRSPIRYNETQLSYAARNVPAFQPAGSLATKPLGNMGDVRALSPFFDTAAFDQAFDAAQADLLESSSTVEPTLNRQEPMAHGRIPEETNPLMRMTWDNQPATYLVVKLWNAFGLSTDGGPFQQDTVQNASAFLRELELFQSNNHLSDEAEVLRTRKILRRILQLEHVPEDAQYQFTERARHLLEKVEADLTAKLDDLTDRDSLQLGDDRYNLQSLEPPHDSLSGEILEQRQNLSQEPSKDDEELARTAAQLLESVSDNTSRKFQESNFLALMRKLRDREVRVEGDKMIESVSSDGMSGNYIPRSEQDYDPGRNAGEPFA